MFLNTFVFLLLCVIFVFYQNFVYVIDDNNNFFLFFISFNTSQFIFSFRLIFNFSLRAQKLVKRTKKMKHKGHFYKFMIICIYKNTFSKELYISVILQLHISNRLYKLYGLFLICFIGSTLSFKIYDTKISICFFQ